MRRRSSSSTAVLASIEKCSRPSAFLPRFIPWCPASDIPKASMMSGAAFFARNRSFTSSENSAPADDSANIDDVSYGARAAASLPSSSACAIGRAIASPTIDSTDTRSRSTSDQISCASSRRDSASTTLPPPCSPIIDAQCAVAVHQRRDRQRHRRVRIRRRQLRELLGRLDRRPARVAALQTGEEHVFVPPHDALRHPRRPARIEDVDVVAGAFAEVALGAASEASNVSYVRKCRAPAPAPFAAAAPSSTDDAAS